MMDINIDKLILDNLEKYQELSILDQIKLICKLYNKKYKYSGYIIQYPKSSNKQIRLLYDKYYKHYYRKPSYMCGM